MPCTPDTPWCPGWTSDADPIRPECCTERLKEVLFATVDILEHHNITYWLDFGTLLGAHRSNEFIPWDTDVDIGFLAEDRRRLKRLKQEFSAFGMVGPVRRNLNLRPTTENVLRIFRSRANLYHADLFQWRRRRDLLVCDFKGVNREAASFDWAEFMNLSTVELYGRTFAAPGNIHTVLQRWYGASYMTPTRGVKPPA